MLIRLLLLEESVQLIVSSVCVEDRIYLVEQLARSSFSLVLSNGIRWAAPYNIPPFSNSPV